MDFISREIAVNILRDIVFFKYSFKITFKKKGSYVKGYPLHYVRGIQLKQRLNILFNFCFSRKGF